MTSLQLGGYDPLDVQLDEAAVASPPPRRASRTVLARWSPSSVPVASLLLLGIVLGPRGVGLVSSGVLTLLDPAIPVALAALGALVGLSLEVGDRRVTHMLGGALLESGLAALLVAMPLLLVAPPVLIAGAIPLWALVCGLGVCAASSLAVPSPAIEAAPTARSRMLALDVLFPIVAGGILLAVLKGADLLAVLAVISQAILITVLLAAAAWLLLVRAGSDTEQRVFAFAVMLLIGGVADYLALSALMSGLVAGTLWRFAAGQAGDSLRRDLLYMQHSVLVLVLIVAGARAELSPTTVGVAAVYVALRTVAKLSAGSLLGRWLEPREPGGGRYLLSPGVFGVAFALNLLRAVGPDATVLLTIVTLGTIGSEVAAEFGRSDDTAPAAGGRIVTT